MKGCWIISFLFLIFCINDAKAKKQGRELIDSLESRISALKEDTNKVNFLNDLSSAYVKVDADRGLTLAIQSVELAKKLQWNKGESWAHNAIANSYLRKSDYPKALDHFFKALKLNEELEDTAAIATVLGNIGSVYYVQRNFDKTLEFCFRGLDFAERLGDKRIILNILGNIGNSYNAKKDHRKAVDYLTRAVSMADELNRREDMVLNLGNLANIYTALGDYSKSLEYNFKALGIARELGLRSSVAIDLGNIGETYMFITQDTTGSITQNKYIPKGKTANLELAINYLKQGVQACKEVGYLAPMAEFNDRLSKAYQMKGDYKAALEAYETFVLYRDSVYSAENKITITHLETQRAVDLKNKQIEINRLAVEKKRNERGFFTAGMVLLFVIILIVFRNYRVQRVLNTSLSVAKQKVEVRTEELDIANKELNTTLVNLQETQQQLIQTEKQKENEIIRRRISQDIHDDISSELTRISWVSELAKTKAKRDDYGDMAGLLEKITTSSRETVAKLGEIIWAASPENDTLDSLFTYMRDHINKFFADTSFITTVDLPKDHGRLPVNPELKRNLYLVMKEALNNIVKYSGAKHVNVSMKIIDNSYKLSITDDGKGIEDGVVQGGGNGLKNMRRRMENVNGYCTITSAPGKGTEICCNGNLY